MCATMYRLTRVICLPLHNTPNTRKSALPERAGHFSLI